MKQITRQDLAKLSHHKQVLFACFCAEQVIHLIKEQHKAICIKAVQTAYLFLEGKVSKEDCKVAANAATPPMDADTNAATYAAYTAVYAAFSTIRAYPDNSTASANYAAHAATYATTSDDYAAYAVAYAAHAADYNAYAAAVSIYQNPITEDQWHFYNELLNGWVFKD